jgi:hypothetical protein
LATLGAISVAAWFSSQFIQKTSQPSLMMRDELAVPEESTMMQKSIPPPEVSEASESAAFSTGEPSLDILWSIVVVLVVVVAGLITELLIKSRKEKQRI